MAQGFRPRISQYQPLSAHDRRRQQQVDPLSSAEVISRILKLTLPLLQDHAEKSPIEIRRTHKLVRAGSITISLAYGWPLTSRTSTSSPSERWDKSVGSTTDYSVLTDNGRLAVARAEPERGTFVVDGRPSTRHTDPNFWEWNSHLNQYPHAITAAVNSLLAASGTRFDPPSELQG